MAVRKKVKTKKKVSPKKMQRGTVGNFFVFGVLALLMIVGIIAVGGLPSQSTPQEGQVVRVITPTTGATYNNLQLKTFGYVTLAPTPTPEKGSLCNSSYNTESEILVGYYPGPGQTTGANGQVKVWVNDEGAPMIAPGETFDTKKDGAIINSGNTNAKDPIPPHFLWEPALYVDLPEEQGGSPHFPNYIRGQVNNNPPTRNTVIKGLTPDPLPAGSKPVSSNPNGNAPNIYNAEYIWDVSKLGLATGTHTAEFIIHDGDTDWGIGCVTIQIQ